jgi:small subunit ribosomal protein S11
MAQKNTKSQKNKKKVQKIVTQANVYVNSSFNNTILTATDLKGNVYAWASTGTVGFKGSKKSTPYAASQTAKAVIEKMHDAKTEEISIFVSGVSSGRDSAVRAFGAAGFKIDIIKDTTPIPHNGCRAKKPRRV